MKLLGRCFIIADNVLGSFEDLCSNTVMETEVLKEIQKHLMMCGRVCKFEIPQAIKLVSEVWTPDQGLVTAALKLKRKNIQERYQNLIDFMYSSQNSSGSSLMWMRTQFSF